MKCAARGPWAKDARVHGEESFASAWKAQIVRFKFRVSTVRDIEVQKLVAVQVRHAYHRRQLELDPRSLASEPRACNFLYASYWDDLVPPSSILDVILVLHHELVNWDTVGGAIDSCYRMAPSFLKQCMYLALAPSCMEVWRHCHFQSCLMYFGQSLTCIRLSLSFEDVT